MNPDLTYYLSGPMTGYEEFNYPAFEDACSYLRGEGLTVVSPHEIPWPENHESLKPDLLWHYMMAGSLLLLEQANAIILLKGWAQSRGARTELRIALDKSYTVYYLQDHVLIDMNRTSYE